jgi:glycosyltransferase involved in cell wall biosynthesis
VVICDTPVLRKSVKSLRGMLRFAGGVVNGTIQGLALMRRERPALLYVNTMTIPLWSVLGRLRRIPVVTHVHEGEATASILVRRVLALPLFLSQAIIANSRFSAGVVTDAFGSLGRRMQVVYNAVPGPPERSPARRRIDGDLRITYVGRLSPRKGVDVAIDAIAELDRRGIPAHLDLVGAVFPGYEWYENDLRNQVKEKALDTRVRFAGFQPSVWEYLAGGDVVLVPSRVDEPFGNTAVEGILSGRPVIASATSGLLEATAGYASATTVTPGDSTSLADALEDAIANWERCSGSAGSDALEAERRHSPHAYRQRIRAIVSALAPRAA